MLFLNVVSSGVIRWLMSVAVLAMTEKSNNTDAVVSIIECMCHTRKTFFKIINFRLTTGTKRFRVLS